MLTLAQKHRTDYQSEVSSDSYTDKLSPHLCSVTPGLIRLVRQASFNLSTFSPYTSLQHE